MDKFIKLAAAFFKEAQLLRESGDSIGAKQKLSEAMKWRSKAAEMASSTTNLIARLKLAKK